MKADYTLSAEGRVIALVDLCTGVSLTNAAADVIAELARAFPDLNRYRVIYRDTTQTWDGMAQRDGRFLGFIPLRTKDRTLAIGMAARGVDRAGRAWPEGEDKTDEA